MNFENRVYNFKPHRHGDTSFRKRFKIDNATPEWDLILKIKGVSAQKIVTTGNGFERIDDNTWEWTEARENLPAGIYNYQLCYKIGETIERTLITGKIEVLKHI